MKIFDPKKIRRLFPVKLIGNQLVKLNDLSVESKYNQRTKSSTKTLETSYSTNSFKSTNSNTNNKKLIRNLSQKFEKLVDDIKNGTEIVGTVEEKKDNYSTVNPFNFKINLDHHNFISKTKKVLFKKPEKNEYVLKVLDNNLYLTIYNKTQPPKRVYNRSEVKKIIKIQKRFRGLAVRDIVHNVIRLKINYSVIETMCLLIARCYDSALKRIMFKTIKKIFHDPFSIDNEVCFEDKLEFRLPDKYYNMTSLQKLDLPKKNKMKSNNS